MYVIIPADKVSNNSVAATGYNGDNLADIHILHKMHYIIKDHSASIIYILNTRPLSW